MKNKLPALTSLLLVAVGGYLGYRSYQQHSAATAARAVTPVAAVEPPSQPTAGDQLMLEARQQLERRTSVVARLRHQVSLAGRQLSGFGGYWQQGSGDDLHMRLEVKFFNDETSLLQVANGRMLWTDQRLPSGRWITRLDLRKVRNEWSRAQLDLEDLDDLEPGRATWSTIEPQLAIRYGGLPTLLLSLSDCFAFQPPQSMRWTPAPPLAGLSESLPVFAVVGHWRPAVLQAFVPTGEDATALPERLPQEVLVLFGQADLFPYRIEFRQQLNPPPTGDGPPPPFQLSGEPLVLVELSNVSFDTPIAAGQFDYSAGDAKWDDRTAEYLEGIRKHRDALIAARRQALQQ